jgi:GNAT superfamily N-acetyltransferase
LGSGLDRARLVQYMQRTYQELYPAQSFGHLAQTVDDYLSSDTPLWWAETLSNQSVGCLWVGNAIDQATGDRHPHIFLLYVLPEHRRHGIGSALMRYVETWARERGDCQIGLQVFQTNEPALTLYEKLGYKVQSLWMVKRFQ